MTCCPTPRRAYRLRRIGTSPRGSIQAALANRWKIFSQSVRVGQSLSFVTTGIVPPTMSFLTFDLPSFFPSFLRSTFDELVLFEFVKYVYSLYLTISHNPPFYIKGLLLLHRGNSSTFISRVVEKFQKLVFHAVERFVF